MNSLVPGSPGFIESLLADRIGLDVASVGEGVITRGVQNRMNQLGVRRQEDYERILLEPSGEIQALIEEVVIPESWFFRDDRPFAAFREIVQAGWVEQPKRLPLSVLCLPCAGGEEPYSVAITLLELGLTRERFEVVAIDISERSIHRAAAGFYGANAFRGVDPRIQSEYFDFTDIRGRYLLKASVRSAVQFHQGNILDSGLLARHAGFDVVFCRNLLIYFDNAARTKAFANLDRLTSRDGYLFLGHADRPDQNVASQFVPSAVKGSFLYQKHGSNLSTPPTMDPPRSGSASRHSPPGSRQAQATTKNRPAPASAPAPRHPEPAKTSAVERSTSRPEASRSQPEPAVALPALKLDEAKDQALALADQGRYDEARQLVRDQIKKAGLDASAHFLLGIIHQAAGDRVNSESELIKAVYLDPEHDEALLALALLARRRGDMAAEALYRRRADRVRARKGRA